MKTEQLVTSLVADRARSTAPLGRSVSLAVATGALVSLLIFAIEFGPRVDLAEAFATWRFDLKLVLVLAALMAASGACVAMARPVATGRWRWGVLSVAAIAAAALGAELVVLPARTWQASLVGSNALMCLIAIPLFALAPLAALLLVLRRTAPASPALAGAAAGALAAAAAAAIYAFHCFDDSPLFVLTWYPLAAIPVIVSGALFGHRLLRW
jgi:hypothetical protein